ncbi:rod shape-determining protein MreC [Streptococcus iniae]|uniref:rod shape-determining protein MreC n=1 Tax=Streptococcus iniae TaxID=1346 RepID=UPI0008D902A2|nr:rod shape-determining protein MreC [Streptococcus iniae]OHX26126.1 rod shape-determining protein MreC [Streptococcus iniae]RLV28760.1 rod shape-determining protein MreC [Streptococcus iniae]
MFKYRFSRFFFFFFSVLIIAVSSIFFLSSSFTTVPSFSNEFLSRLDVFIAKPFHSINSSINDLKKLSSAVSKNKSLSLKLGQLENENQLLKRYKRENIALKKILDTKIDSPFSHVSKVIVRTPQSWTDSLIISSGSNQALRENMLVTSGGFLVGRVSGVTRSSSHVDLLTCGKLFNLPIKVVDKKRSIYGNLKHFNTDSQLMIASEFNSSDPIEIGTKVYTSGLDGESVSDIVVGKVVTIKESPDKLKREIGIQLFADFSTIDYVDVLGEK